MSPPSAAELEAARAAIAARHRAGGSGPEICAAYTDLTDAVIGGLFRAAVAEGRPSEAPLSVIAIGGYGRRELAPQSDVDLLFSTPDAKGWQPIIDATLHGLWDRRLQVGFATRSTEESLALATEDLHTATALLNARSVAGDPEPLHVLRAGLWSLYSGRRGDTLLADLDAGMKARHARYGSSVYLLEPNIKQSPGGLRDLSVALWAAVLRYRVESIADLLRRGVSTPLESKAMGRARAFLLRVRTALHLASGHRSDRLTFEYQAQVASDLGFGEARGDIERFMAAFYGHAAQIDKRARLILNRCRAVGRPRRPGASRPVGEHFRLFDGHLTLTDARLFERAPIEAMRLFAVARREGQPIHGYAREQAMEIAPTLAALPDAQWRAHPEVVAAFRDLLSGPTDPHDALGDLHETGVLAAMIPEFGAVTHRTHHDLYHTYTVDIHTLHALRGLHALRRGDLATDEPLLSEALGQITRPFVLYLALLMHDAGKALGRGHAVKGARLMPAVARRLGLSPEDARLAEWLVRDHLLLAHISQRRDLADDQLIGQVCRQVGSSEALAMLFVLTWADASTTGPQAYTDWKAALLAELYVRASNRFRGGLDLYEDPQRRVARMRRAVTARLFEKGDPRIRDIDGAVDAFFRCLPTRYFQKTRIRTVARHIELLERLAEEPPVTFFVDARPRRGYTHLHLAAMDRFGLLAEVAGVLAAHRLDILAAEVHNTSDGRVLDIFRLREAGGDPPTEDPARWVAVRADLVRVLGGELEVAALLAERARPADRFAWPEGPPVESRVGFDAQAVPGYTILEVRTRDRPGILHDIARSVAMAGASIALARITTDSDGVDDTFYVTAREGGPLDSAAARALVEAVGADLEANP